MKNYLHTTNESDSYYHGLISVSSIFHWYQSFTNCELQVVTYNIFQVRFGGLFTLFFTPAVAAELWRTLDTALSFFGELAQSVFSTLSSDSLPGCFSLSLSESAQQENQLTIFNWWFEFRNQEFTKIKIKDWKL